MSNSYHHGDLRQALIEETLEMIRNDESHLIGFRELARRVGVSRTAPYRHFEDIDELLTQVAAGGFKEFIQRLQAAENRELPPRANVVALGEAYIDFARANPSHYRLMFESRFFSCKGEQVPSLAGEAFGILQSAVARCLPDSSPKGLDYELAMLAWSTVHGMSKLLIDRQISDDNDTRSLISRSCERMLGILDININN